MYIPPPSIDPSHPVTVKKNFDPRTRRGGKMGHSDKKRNEMCTYSATAMSSKAGDK